jgi:Zn ribbon nucleic-acid-binding protein
MAVELCCPRCGSSDLHQLWYNRFVDGHIVPNHPAMPDGDDGADLWDCAACGFVGIEVDITELGIERDVGEDWELARMLYFEGVFWTEIERRLPSLDRSKHAAT